MTSQVPESITDTVLPSELDTQIVPVAGSATTSLGNLGTATLSAMAPVSGSMTSTWSSPLATTRLWAEGSQAAGPGCSTSTVEATASPV